MQSGKKTYTTSNTGKTAKGKVSKTSTKTSRTSFGVDKSKTSSRGKMQVTNFDKKLDKVWGKAATVPGKSPKLYRKDVHGNVIYKPSYGKKSSMGWEVDHKNPRSKGGTDNVRNLDTVHWKGHGRTK